MKRFAPFVLFLFAAILAAAPARAAFHLMKIVEVFPGTEAAPTAQYVQLQMYAAGQNLVNGHSVQVFDSTGGLVSTSTFGGNLTNSANQTKILVGTAAVPGFFGTTVDLVMPSGTISLAGGKVCFDTIDCMAWGNYSGSPTGVGTPFQATSGGLRLGRAAVRRLDIADSGSPTVLEAGDDTNVSARDFVFGAPAPRNNAGTNGTIPSSTCGDHVLGGLEACDDGNTAPGDGCRADCAGLELCGDLFIDTAVSETCDDGNTVGGDRCPSNCGVPLAGAPGEASPSSDLRASRGVGTGVNVTFTPACSATDTTVYWGISAASGGASFDPGSLAPGQLLYFVLVGNSAGFEGAYGFESPGLVRPEAAGIGACDQPYAVSICQ